jgi:hypothetical protein
MESDRTCVHAKILLKYVHSGEGLAPAAAAAAAAAAAGVCGPGSGSDSEPTPALSGSLRGPQDSVTRALGCQPVRVRKSAAVPGTTSLSGCRDDSKGP